MRHRDRNVCQRARVTCYLDESATDNGSPVAVVGGLVIEQTHYAHLVKEWVRLIDKFNLHPGVHMKDFGQHGRHSRMEPAIVRRILQKLVALIGDHCIHTIGVTLATPDYQEMLSKIDASQRRFALSQYALCAMGCFEGVRQVAEGRLNDSIDYILDCGNAYAIEVQTAHRAITRMQETREHQFFAGNLSFEQDDFHVGLQAADVFCWAMRRKSSESRFGFHLEPLLALFGQKGFNAAPMSPVLLRMLAETYCRLGKERVVVGGTTDSEVSATIAPLGSVELSPSVNPSNEAA